MVDQGDLMRGKVDLEDQAFKTRGMEQELSHKK